MVRRLIAGVALISALLFGVAMTAWAAPGDSGSASPQVQVQDTYNAISVLGTSSAVSHATKTQLIQVLPTSSTKANLSFTGVSFNVPLTIAIAAIVVLLGIVLTVLGTRGAFGARRQH